MHRHRLAGWVERLACHSATANLGCSGKRQSLGRPCRTPCRLRVCSRPGPPWADQCPAWLAQGRPHGELAPSRQHISRCKVGHLNGLMLTRTSADPLRAASRTRARRRTWLPKSCSIKTFKGLQAPLPFEARSSRQILTRHHSTPEAVTEDQLWN